MMKLEAIKERRREREFSLAAERMAFEAAEEKPSPEWALLVAGHRDSKRQAQRIELAGKIFCALMTEQSHAGRRSTLDRWYEKYPYAPGAEIEGVAFIARIAADKLLAELETDRG